MIEFGKTYRDIVSGFEGICTGKVEWMYGCTQYILAPKVESTSKKEYSSTFFEKQLEEVDAGISDRVEAPVVGEQRFFGKECVDKVTGIRGMCIGATSGFSTATSTCCSISRRQIPGNMPFSSWTKGGLRSLQRQPVR